MTSKFLYSLLFGKPINVSITNLDDKASYDKLDADEALCGGFVIIQLQKEELSVFLPRDGDECEMPNALVQVGSRDAFARALEQTHIQSILKQRKRDDFVLSIGKAVAISALVAGGVGVMSLGIYGSCLMIYKTSTVSALISAFVCPELHALIITLPPCVAWELGGSQLFRSVKDVNEFQYPPLSYPHPKKVLAIKAE
jgi:hypothetical protein